MVVLITYDITCNKTRARLHHFLKEFGLNTQKSVFECELDREGLTGVVRYCRALIDPATDSVRFYRICEHCLRKVRVSGKGLKIVRLDYLIV